MPSYLGETGQITQRQLVGGAVATSWIYFPNSVDRRLHAVANWRLRSYEYATTAENLVTIANDQNCCQLLHRWDCSYDNANRLVSASLSGAAAPYTYTLDPVGNVTLFTSPSALSKSATYNNVNERTSLAGQPFSYDGNGNLASDGASSPPPEQPQKSRPPGNDSPDGGPQADPPTEEAQIQQRPIS